MDHKYYPAGVDHRRAAAIETSRGYVVSFRRPGYVILAMPAVRGPCQAGAAASGRWVCRP